MTQNLDKQKAIQISCEGNMQLMARYPDNYFDLAIVDPPYGNACNLKGGSSSTGKNGWSGMMRKANEWNNEPNKQYFDELIRVSKNQIIWGANHFIDKIPMPFSCFLIWDKGQREFSLADGEMAWTSFKGAARFYTYARAKALKEGKIHPTQKPISLYQWMINRFCKEGDKILDTHIGSGSIAIAVDSVNKIEKMNLTLVGCEIDKDYYDKTMKRINEKTSWQSLF